MKFPKKKLFKTLGPAKEPYFNLLIASKYKKDF